jgi:glutathione S-transferase
MITVHHLNNSRSQRVLWLLEELGLEYDVKRYERDPETMRAPASLQAIYPLGKSPVIDDNGLVIAETGAVIEYLIETYGRGRLKPAVGTPEGRRYTYWLHYAEGSLAPLLLLKLIVDRMETAKAPFFIRPITKSIARRLRASLISSQLPKHLTYIEAELSQRQWFAGSDMTAADIMMSFPLEGAAARGALDSAKPQIQAFLKRIHALPTYQRALERGGQYDILTGD